MATVLLCPGCGVGMATRRGLRLHLLVHGLSWNETHGVATNVVRSKTPPNWRCKGCRRKFATVRGLSAHSRSSGHGEAPGALDDLRTTVSRRRAVPV